VPAAAALEHLRLREALDLDSHVTRLGALLDAELIAIAKTWPHVFSEPRGHGLMRGLPVREPFTAAAFVAPALDEGLIINAAGRNTLRFIPALIISEAELAEGMARLRRTIATVLA
jgi:acetylornithine/succinyldiaminopimelate/putrescine aminotransferase